MTVLALTFVLEVGWRALIALVVLALCLAAILTDRDPGR